MDFFLAYLWKDREECMGRNEDQVHGNWKPALVGTNGRECSLWSHGKSVS